MEMTPKKKIRKLSLDRNSERKLKNLSRFLEFLSQRYERTLKDVSSLLSKTRYTGSYTESELKRSGGEIALLSCGAKSKVDSVASNPDSLKRDVFEYVLETHAGVGLFARSTRCVNRQDVR